MRNASKWTKLFESRGIDLWNKKLSRSKGQDRARRVLRRCNQAEKGNHFGRIVQSSITEISPRSLSHVNMKVEGDRNGLAIMTMACGKEHEIVITLCHKLRRYCADPAFETGLVF